MGPFEFELKLREIRCRDPRYRPEAYLFVLEALKHTVRRLGREQKAETERHVSGRDLLEGIRLLALQEFGPLGRVVFEHWGVRATEDFGEIVFLLVEAELLRKTSRDSKDDFKDGFDFEETFEKGYRVEPALPGGD